MNDVVCLAEARLRKAVNQDFDRLIDFLQSKISNRVVGVFYEILIELHHRCRAEYGEVLSAFACWRADESRGLMPILICEDIEWVSRDAKDHRVPFIAMTTRFDTAATSRLLSPERIRIFIDEYTDWMVQVHRNFGALHVFSKIPMLLFSVMSQFGFILTSFHYNPDDGRVVFSMHKEHHSAQVTFDYGALLEEVVRQRTEMA